MPAAYHSCHCERPTTLLVIASDRRERSNPQLPKGRLLRPKNPGLAMTAEEITWRLCIQFRLLKNIVSSPILIGALQPPEDRLR